MNLLDSDKEESDVNQEKSETISDDEQMQEKDQLKSLINIEDKEEISQLFKNIKVSLADYNEKIIQFSEITQENNIEKVIFNLI